MSEMIERVKQALIDNIAASLGEGGSVDYDYAARAAIEVMREPTEAMVAAAPPTHGVDAVGGRFELLPGGVRSTWRAMANAALAETPK